MSKKKQKREGGIIYKATHKVNGKIYVGLSTVSLQARINSHRDARVCKSKTYKTIYFLNALRAEPNGVDAFHWKEIDRADTTSELKKKETYWIAALNSRNTEIGYNIQKGGDLREITEEGRQRIIELNSHKVFCHQTGKIYPSIKKAEEEIHTRVLKTSDSLLLATKGYTFEKIDPNKDYSEIKPIPRNTKYCKPVYCFQTGTVYESIAYAERELKITNIGKVLSGEHSQSRGYEFEYAIDGKEYPILPLHPVIPTRTYPIYCHQTQKIYDDAFTVAKELEIIYEYIHRHLGGKKDNCNGYTFEFVDETKTYPLPKREMERVKLPGEYNWIPVRCNETGEVFNSIIDAIKKSGVSKDGIYGVLRGKYKYTGKDRLTFSYVD